MKKNRIILISFVLILLFSTVSLASKPKLPESSFDFYIYDEAKIIDDSTSKYIIEVNKTLNKETGAQVVVASINDLGNVSIQSYATALFEKWKIGSKEYDNGILILIAPEEGEIWIEIGYGLEGPIPDSRAKRIIENNIIPYFRQGDFSTGVLSGFNEIITLIEEEYNISLNREEIDEKLYTVGISSGGGSDGFDYRIILIILLILFINSRLNRGRKGYRRYGGYRGYGGFRGGGSFGGSRGTGGFGGGGRSGGGGAGGKW